MMQKPNRYHTPRVIISGSHIRNHGSVSRVDLLPGASSNIRHNTCDIFARGQPVYECGQRSDEIEALWLQATTFWGHHISLAASDTIVHRKCL